MILQLFILGISLQLTLCSYLMIIIDLQFKNPVLQLSQGGKNLFFITEGKNFTQLTDIIYRNSSSDDSTLMSNMIGNTNKSVSFWLYSNSYSTSTNSTIFRYDINLNPSTPMFEVTRLFDSSTNKDKIRINGRSATNTTRWMNPTLTFPISTWYFFYIGLQYKNGGSQTFIVKSYNSTAAIDNVNTYPHSSISNMDILVQMDNQTGTDIQIWAGGYNTPCNCRLEQLAFYYDYADDIPAALFYQMMTSMPKLVVRSIVLQNPNHFQDLSGNNYLNMANNTCIPNQSGYILNCAQGQVIKYDIGSLRNLNTFIQSYSICLNIHFGDNEETGYATIINVLDIDNSNKLGFAVDICDTFMHVHFIFPNYQYFPINMTFNSWEWNTLCFEIMYIPYGLNIIINAIKVTAGSGKYQYYEYVMPNYTINSIMVGNFDYPKTLQIRDLRIYKGGHYNWETNPKPSCSVSIGTRKYYVISQTSNNIEALGDYMCITCFGLLTSSTCNNSNQAEPCNTTCTSCNSICSRCVGSSTTCTLCAAGSYLQSNNTCSNTCSNGFVYLPNDTCLNSCPTNYYGNKISGNCKSCSSPCLNCLNRTVCTSCIQDYQFNASISQCLITCGDGYYLNSSLGSCLACDESCLTCYGSLSTQCITCPLNTYFYSGSCLNKPNGCSIVDPSSGCISCLDTYFLDTNNACTQSCPIGYYPDTYKKKCLACDTNCSNCTSFGLGCTGCYSGQYLNTSYSICQDDCQGSFFKDSFLSICVKCHSSCLTCNGPSSSNCLTCSDSRYFNPSTSECQTECKGSSFGNSSTHTCQPCDETCLTCSGPTFLDCTRCTVDLFLNSTSRACQMYCKGSYFPNIATNNCDICDSTCLTCTSSNNSSCTSCQTGLYLTPNSSCKSAPTSPMTYYADNDTMTFKPCPPECLTCYNNKICASCPDNTFLENGLCIEDCSPGFYGETTNNTCVACNISCQTCYKAGHFGCLTCTDDLYLIDGECIGKPESFKNAETIGNIAGSTAIGLALPLIATGNPGILMESAKSLQFTSYIVLLNIKLPKNVQIFLNSYSFTKLKFMPNLFEPLRLLTNTTIPATNGRFAMNGYSSLFLVNCGKWLSLFLIILSLSLISTILYQILGKYKPKLLLKLQKIKYIFCWTLIIHLIIIGFTELMVGIGLQFTISVSPGIYSYMSFFSAYFAFIGLIMFIIIMISKLRDQRDVYKLSFQKQYGPIYLDFKTESLLTRSFNFIDFIRKAFFSLWLIQLTNYPIIQMLLISLGNFIYIILLMKYNPYYLKSNNFIRLLTEILNFLIDMMLLILATVENFIDSTTNDNIGYIILVLMAGILLCNLSNIAYHQFVIIYEMYKNYKKKQKRLVFQKPKFTL